MVRIVGAGRQLCVVSKNLADRENTGWRAPISLFLTEARLALPCESCSPGEPVLTEQRRKWSDDNLPVAAAGALAQSQVAPHRIPRRRDSQDKLCAIVGNAICASVVCQPN